jgi:radical SAM superfamily enzyme YgiQ (UPF0313 family)
VHITFVTPPIAPGYGDPRIIRSRDAVENVNAPALGVLSLAAVVRSEGHHATLVDLNQRYVGFLHSHRSAGDFVDYASDCILAEGADVIGLSTICSTYPITLRIARSVKAKAPKSTLILGGPQATVVDVDTMQAFPEVDLIVRGEAEQSLPMLLTALNGQTDLGKVAGLTFRRGRNVIVTPPPPLIENLDQLPLPAYDLHPPVDDSTWLSLELGRGCPFSCSFCSTNDFFRRRHRLKSPALMIAQMSELVARYGVRPFNLVHDMFTVDRKRVVQFCFALKQSVINVRWACSARTDCVDDELLELMRSAGCIAVFYGVETGSAHLQRVIDKGLSIDQVRERVAQTSAVGIQSTVSLIVGFPGETRQDLTETIGLYLDVARDSLVCSQLHLLAPLAKTPLHTEYRDRITFDGIVSDLSHQGWKQDPVDRLLISIFPDLFPNFYALPGTLPRPWLESVRLFHAYGLLWARWLMVALRHRLKDTVQLCDEWLSFSITAVQISSA